MSATLHINACRWLVRPDGEMDITTVFGTVGPSSILGRGTDERSARTRNENTRHGMMPSEAGMVQW